MSKKRKQATKAERHHRDLELLVRLRNLDRKTVEECAGELKVSPRTIKYWLASDEYKTLRAEMQAEWREHAEYQVADLSALALQTMKDLMENDKSGHVRFEAAKAIGDWLGLGQHETEERADDRAELERLARILAERPAQIDTQQNVYVMPPEPGGFLPKPLQRVVESNDYLAAIPSPKEEIRDEVVEAPWNERPARHTR